MDKQAIVKLSVCQCVQVRMTGGAGLMDMNGLPGGKSSELEDKQKEQEEADFSFSPDDLEKYALVMLCTCSMLSHADTVMPVQPTCYMQASHAECCWAALVLWLAFEILACKSLGNVPGQSSAVSCCLSVCKVTCCVQPCTECHASLHETSPNV